MVLKRNAIVFMLSCAVTLLIITGLKLIKYKAMYESQIQITEEIQKNNKDLRSDLDKKAIKINELEKENYELKNKWIELGIFKITYYCDCKICQGKYIGTTAIGNKPKVKRTIAVDPNVIELGSTVKINNNYYIAEDTGGAIKGNIIDVFVASHKDAIENGVNYQEVKVWKKN